MTSPPKPQDPALLDGASSRFANAFTRRLTRVREAGSPRPWIWIAGAAALTACVVLVTFAVAKFSSLSDDEAKAAGSAAVSENPGASSSPLPLGSSPVPDRRDDTGAAEQRALPPRAIAETVEAAGGSGTSDRTGGPTTRDGSGASGGTTPAKPAASSASDSRSGTSAEGSVGGQAGTQSAGGTTEKKQAVTYPGVQVYSHHSGRCVTAAGTRNTPARDGTRLEIRDCTGGSWQKIDFRADGTARMFDLCIDIAAANQNNGTPIQLAQCNGGWAQKFILNKAHDLVNTSLGKCIDAVDKKTANGTRLQLWTCYGTDNQKWSKR